MVTRLSTAAISRSNGNVPSIDTSSTSTISKVSPLASITDLSRAYKPVTFSCSLWSETTIEYLSTVSFYYTGTRRRFAVTSVRRESDGLEARFRSLRVVLQEPALSGAEGWNSRVPDSCAFFFKSGIPRLQIPRAGWAPRLPDVYYLVPPPPPPV